MRQIYIMETSEQIGFPWFKYHAGELMASICSTLINTLSVFES